MSWSMTNFIRGPRTLARCLNSKQAAEEWGQRSYYRVDLFSGSGAWLWAALDVSNEFVGQPTDFFLGISWNDEREFVFLYAALVVQSPACCIR
jgi:hypothetical protein